MYIECDDVYETMKRDIARFDTSDYPPDNAYGMPLVNKKVPSLMKDENNGAIMIEFVGLRAKMYAVSVDGRKDIKKAKGVKNNVIARTIMFDDYTRCLNEEIEMSGALTLCAECMVRLADINIGVLYVKKHEIDTLNALNSRFCFNCQQCDNAMQHVPNLHKLKKDNIVNESYASVPWKSVM
ncbi:uncharacterized protein LOC105423468 [Pogonomyrmex barbatus]|uniref:Uncharacterized protein LOC105423468 n=1 Tax=Pogonomyrmex barbatus TaxID=144034 RepID=A0A8N1S3B1_9HYME|nr:uncharacterized protein LOC105423468 [Pogonomyrmex barbatus]